MNFRRILLTGAALGSAAALTAACSNSDDVVLTIPTTDSAVTGNESGPRGEGDENNGDDGRFIARCSTEADDDGFAGQTFFTDGSSDFSDYCLQRFYSGVQPAPGAVYVPRENRENPSREAERPAEGGGEQSDGGDSQPQRVPTDGQVLAEGQSARNQNITEGGGAGQQSQNETGRAGVGAEQNQPSDNFGAANAGSPNRPGEGNNAGGNQNGNANPGNQGGNNNDGGNNNTGGGNDQGGNNTGGNNTGGNNTGNESQPTTPTSPEQGGNDDEGTTVPGLPGVTIPPLPSRPETTQPSTPGTTRPGQTTTPQDTQSPQETPQQGGQTQTQTPSQSPQGTGSTEQQTPAPGANQGTIEDTATPTGNGQGAVGGSEFPQFPQFPPLQVPDVGEVLSGISS